MATTKIKFRPSSVAGKEGTLFFQVIHKREVRQVSTTYKVFPHEWDAVRQEIVMPPCKLRKKYLLALQDALMKNAIRLRIIILSLTQQQSAYTAEDIVQRFLNRENTSEFEAFAENIIQTKRKEGHTALADKYQSNGTDTLGLTIPYICYFKINTHYLTNNSQFEYLSEIVRIAKDHNMAIRVIGAADSATGAAAINQRISEERAGYISAQLIALGMSADNIQQQALGGIEEFTPVANTRYCKIQLIPLSTSA